MSSAVGLPVGFTEQGHSPGPGLPEQVGNEVMNEPSPCPPGAYYQFLLEESCIDFLEQGKWMGEMRGTQPPRGM